MFNIYFSPSFLHLSTRPSLFLFFHLTILAMLVLIPYVIMPNPPFSSVSPDSILPFLEITIHSPHQPGSGRKKGNSPNKGEE